MPDLNGVEFLREWASICSDCGQIPALLMSAHRPREMALEGVDQYLPKPLTIELLIARLRELLQFPT